MHNSCVFFAGITPALTYVRRQLSAMGIPIAESPGWDTGHLFLDVPSFRPGSPLCDSGNLDTLLGALPKDTVIWGGNLDTEALEGFRRVDLLKDEIYLAENAAITADCTIQIAAPLLTATWSQTPTLIIGWGRIGKCLGQLLKNMGCPVTIAARNSTDRAALGSLGYQTADTNGLKDILPRFRLIVNTVPAMMIPEEDSHLIENIVGIDLASKKGMAGEHVVWARGLPGIYAPESVGKLMAKSFLRLKGEVES